MANSALTVPNITTPVTVAQGGTGASSLTGVLLGNGTSAITAIATNGTGNAVLTTTPTLVTPVLGVATATSINKVTVTAPTTSATLTLVTGSSLITAGSFALTLTSTATTNATFPTGTVTLVGTVATQTLTNKRITKRAVTASGAATAPSVNTDSNDLLVITGLSASPNMTTNLTGTPVEGDTYRVAITDNGTPQTITWGTKFEASTVALPTTTVASTRLDVGFFWNTATSKWRVVAVA